jgi:Neuraminidase (sialidase)
VIQDVINRTAEINSALGARASAVVQSSSDISHALLEQLKQLAEQGKDLPAALVDVSSYRNVVLVKADV